MTDNGKISLGEFRGRVATSLEYIEKDISFIKKELPKKACKKDIDDLRKEISNIKLVSKLTVVIGATLTAIGALLGFKKG